MKGTHDGTAFGDRSSGSSGGGGIAGGVDGHIATGALRQAGRHPTSHRDTGESSPGDSRRECHPPRVNRAGLLPGICWLQPQLGVATGLCSTSFSSAVLVMEVVAALHSAAMWQSTGTQAPAGCCCLCQRRAADGRVLDWNAPPALQQGKERGISEVEEPEVKMLSDIASAVTIQSSRKFQQQEGESSLESTASSNRGKS